MKRQRVKYYFVAAAAVAGCLLAALYGIRAYTARVAAPYLTDHAAELPERKAALLLGTSPKLADGRSNTYFHLRIRAAADLYRAGKVRYIIVSGDNRKHGYNEPEAMKAALVAQGIPAEKIVPDYAGIRTLDSVLRARSIFGQESYIVVSQKFHNERAVYLARAHGIDAYGYNAADVDRYSGFKTEVREYLARVKMLLDLAVQKAPRHQGEPVRLPED